LIAIGIAIGVLYFREWYDDSVPWDELESEVIDPSIIEGRVPFLPPED